METCWGLAILLRFGCWLHRGVYSEMSSSFTCLISMLYSSKFLQTLIIIFKNNLFEVSVEELK